VLRDMLAAGGGGRVPSVVYTALMQEHLAAGEWTHALDVFATMTAGAKTLNVHTYNLYLAALQAGSVHALPFHCLQLLTRRHAHCGHSEHSDDTIRAGAVPHAWIVSWPRRGFEFSSTVCGDL
jgi:hypothetical protein